MVDMGDITGTAVIQPSLDTMEPGPAMAACLAAIDMTALSGYDRVTVLQAHSRMVAHHQARMYDAMHAIADVIADPSDPQEGYDDAAAEIRVALRLTRRAADNELSFALDLRQRLPDASTLLAAGRLSLRQVRAIDRATAHLPAATVSNVVEGILDAAPDLTTGEIGAELRRRCADADPEDARKRHDSAVEDRRVVMEATPDGVAHIHALNLSPDRAAAVMRTVNRYARSLRASGDGRSMDQLRADVFADLHASGLQANGMHASGLQPITSTEDTAADTSREGSTNGHPGPAPDRGTVDIVVDLDTLAGLRDGSGDLSGYGPVVADIARRVVDESHGAEWRYTVIDPATGRAVGSGTTRRRPSTALRRFVEARDRRCVFPGCRMPAADCDIDHITPWAEGGSTTERNLAPLCRHDHGLHTRGSWTYASDEEGRYRWRSPLGRTYRTRRATGRGLHPGTTSAIAGASGPGDDPP